MYSQSIFLLFALAESEYKPKKTCRFISLEGANGGLSNWAGELSHEMKVASLVQNDLMQNLFIL